MNLVALDDYLIDKVFEKFARWFQISFGKTNFWLAKVCLWATIIACSQIILLSLIFCDSCPAMVFIIFICLVMISSTLSIIRKCEAEENKFFTQETTTLNRVRITQRLVRIFSVYLIIFLSIEAVLFIVFSWNGIDFFGFLYLLMSSIAQYTIIAGVYFYACTPLPLGKSKAKEFIESLKGLKQLIFAPARG